MVKDRSLRCSFRTSCLSIILHLVSTKDQSIYRKTRHATAEELPLSFSFAYLLATFVWVLLKFRKKTVSYHWNDNILICKYESETFTKPNNIILYYKGSRLGLQYSSQKRDSYGPGSIGLFQVCCGCNPLCMGSQEQCRHGILLEAPTNKK